MAAPIVRGNPITLDLFSTDGYGVAVDVPDLTASIVDANGATVVLDHVTTFVATGHRRYVFAVPLDAPLGAWAVQWAGTIDGAALTAVDGFTVLAVGSLTPSTPLQGQTCTPWVTHADPFCAATLEALATTLGDADAAALELDTCLQIATDILWNLTGQRWSGTCDDYIRPQAQWRQSDVPRWWPAPVSDATNRWGWCSCNRPRLSGCSRLPEIRLPNGPVHPSGLVVKVDGATLVESVDYRVDDSRYVVRLGGDGWPCCQDLLVDDDQDHSFSIAYVYGANPPIGGVRAAAQYGCQLAAAFNPGAGECKLPKGVVSIARQGVTTRFLDPTAYVEKGMVGLVAVDNWVASVNAGKKSKRASVFFPGRTRASRRPNH